MEAQLKVSRAITRLGYEKPFYGSCAMTLKVYENNSIGTMCTDGRSIQWSREFVDTLSEDECRAIIAHEVLHVIFQHHLRFPSKDPKDHKRWNYATDHAINNTLKEDGFVFPKGVLCDPKYKDWNGERIYNDLDPDAF